MAKRGETKRVENTSDEQKAKRESEEMGKRVKSEREREREIAEGREGKQEGEGAALGGWRSAGKARATTR